MAYNTFEAYKRNLFTKTKKDRETTQKINKLENQLKRNKNVFTYGKKTFKTKESAQKYLKKIKSARNVKALIRFNEIQAKHELQRLDRVIKKGKNLKGFEYSLKLKFPKGILGKKDFYKKDNNVTYTQLLEQLRINFYGDIGSSIIGLGQATNNETLKNQGSIIYTLSKMGALQSEDYDTIYKYVFSVSSMERMQDTFITKLIQILDVVIRKYISDNAIKKYISGGY